MATIIDAFVVTLGLDPAGYNKGMGQTREGVKRTKDEALRAGKDIEAGGKQAAQFIGSLKTQVLGLFTAFTAGVGIKDFVRDTIAVDASTGRLARNLGVATEELSAWEGVMRKVGGTNADADQSVQSLVSAFQQIQLTGQSPLIPYLQLLGVSLKDLKDPTATLLKLSDAFAGMDPQRAQALGAGMGLSPAMITTLQQGRIATEALLVEQLRLGVITKEDAERAQQLQATLSGLKDSSSKLGRDLLTSAIPALEFLGRLLTRVATWAQENGAVVTGAFYGMAAAAVALGIALAAPVAPYIALAAGIAAVGAAIGFLIQDFQSFQNGGPSAIDWRPFVGGIEAAQQGAKALGDAFMALMNAGAELLATIPPGVWVDLGRGFTALGRLLLDGVVTVINMAVNSLKTMAALIRLITDLLKGDWSAAWKDAGDVAKGTVDQLTTAWDGAKNALSRYFAAAAGKGEPLPDRPKPRASGGDAGAPRTMDGAREMFDAQKLTGSAEERSKTLLRGHEGFREKAYWDVDHYRAGYGSDTKTDARTGRVTTVTADTRVTRADAEADLARRTKIFMDRAAAAVGKGWEKLNANTQAALTSVTYNYGHLPQSVALAAQTGDTEKIAAAIQRLETHNGGVNASRRRSEAQIAQTTPRAAPAPAVVAAKPPPANGRATASAAKPPPATTAAIKQTFRVQQAQTTLARKPVTTGAAVAAPVAHRPGPTANDNRTSHETHIGTVAIYTQSKDAPGIARDISKAIDQRSVATQANSGLS